MKPRLLFHLSLSGSTNMWRNNTGSFFFLCQPSGWLKESLCLSVRGLQSWVKGPARWEKKKKTFGKTHSESEHPTVTSRHFGLGVRGLCYATCGFGGEGQPGNVVEKRNLYSFWNGSEVWLTVSFSIQSENWQSQYILCNVKWRHRHFLCKIMKKCFTTHIRYLHSVHWLFSYHFTPEYSDPRFKKRSCFGWKITFWSTQTRLEATISCQKHK